MDFGYSSEQDLLRKSFADFLAKECTFDSVKEWFNDPKGYAPAVWKKMADLGWMELVCEAFENKDGDNFLDAMILFEEVGRALLPSPLFASAVMAGFILSHIEKEGGVSKDLSDIKDGKKIFTVGLVDVNGRYDHKRPGVEAVLEKNGNYGLSGTRLFVPYADAAHSLLLCADVKDPEAGGPTLFKIKTNSRGVSVSPMNTLYPERKCRVELKKVVAGPEDIVGNIGWGELYVDAVIGPATVLKCAEMMGGMGYICQTTVQYVKDRHQFGKPLGILQAVQHHCADMATLYEGARIISYQAASLINDGLPSNKEVAMAKAWVSDAYKKCTWISHQVHGAIGFTEEYPIHLYYRHAKENEILLGDSRHHRAKLIEMMGLCEKI